MEKPFANQYVCRRDSAAAMLLVRLARQMGVTGAGGLRIVFRLFMTPAGDHRR